MHTYLNHLQVSLKHWGLLQSIEVINSLERNQSVGLRPVVSCPVPLAVHLDVAAAVPT